MDKNITIPMSLLWQIIELLEYFDISMYDQAIHEDYNDIMNALMKKKHSIELRDAYSRIINAKNDDDRDEERIRYLNLKRLLDE